jgi:hypothetical protein
VRVRCQGFAAGGAEVDLVWGKWPAAGEADARVKKMEQAASQLSAKVSKRFNHKDTKSTKGCTKQRDLGSFLCATLVLFVSLWLILPPHAA